MTRKKIVVPVGHITITDRFWQILGFLDLGSLQGYAQARGIHCLIAVVSLCCRTDINLLSIELVNVLMRPLLSLLVIFIGKLLPPFIKFPFKHSPIIFNCVYVG